MKFSVSRFLNFMVRSSKFVEIFICDVRSSQLCSSLIGHVCSLGLRISKHAMVQLGGSAKERRSRTFSARREQNAFIIILQCQDFSFSSAIMIQLFLKYYPRLGPTCIYCSLTYSLLFSVSLPLSLFVCMSVSHCYWVFGLICLRVGKTAIRLSFSLL